MDEPKKRKLIVGLDFGTTHTGIKYAMEGDSHVSHVDEWPLPNDKTIKAQKNPTLIAYTSTGAGSGTPWGYKIDNEEDIRAWMKYHLDKLSVSTTYDDPNLTQAIQDGIFCSREATRSPDEIATDYMKEVLKFSVGFLKKKFREVQIPDGFLDVISVEWWLVRPAIWSSQAVLRLQQIVKKAAKEASFYRPRDTFNFVTEADAASFCLLFEAAAHDELADGDVAIVCDSGGGTVDVAVYEIRETLPLKMREVAAGLGGKCGSSCIDLEFDHFMKNRFGEAYSSMNPSATKVRSAFMRGFETFKHAFNVKVDNSEVDDLEMRIPLDMKDMDPGLVPGAYYRKQDREVVLTRSDMERIFQPTVERILRLVTEQYDAALTRTGEQSVKRLMMAGGFARSKYLQAKLRDWCESVGVRFKALEDSDSWGAIAHGAVLQRLEDIEIEGRLSRFHTGVRCGLLYDADADEQYREDMYLCPFYEVDMTNNCVSWYSHRGDIIDEHHKRSGKFCIGLVDGQQSFEMDIVTSSATEPPRHYYRSAHELQQAGIAKQDSNAKLVSDIGVLKVRLLSIDQARYRDQTPGQGSLIKFEYVIEETMGSSQGSLMYRAVDALDCRPIGETRVQLPRLE
ncbi:actin-like ATPase domain containing protein [Rhypophila sp. PSN 637]